MSSGAVRAEEETAAPATSQNFDRSASSVSTRNDCPCENPADGPRTALPRIRVRQAAGTGSPVNVRTMRRRRTTSWNSIADHPSDRSRRQPGRDVAD
jgi:hypothetical protein